VLVRLKEERLDVAVAGNCQANTSSASAAANSRIPMLKNKVRRMAAPWWKRSLSLFIVICGPARGRRVLHGRLGASSSPLPRFGGEGLGVLRPAPAGSSPSPPAPLQG
jgi:hypothetical protein